MENPTHENVAPKPPYSGNIITELVKALAWPMVALIGLVSFWSPIHQIVDVIPDLLENPIPSLFPVCRSGFAKASQTQPRPKSAKH
jgi:hypothetical protein